MPVGLIFLLFATIAITNCVVRGLTRYDTNTCYDGKARAYYCCSNYEEINAQCIECKPGFQSRDGTACEPCSFKLFGKGCSKECNCNDLQRCDNIKGCVDMETTSTLASNSNSAIATSSEESVTMTHKDEHNYGTGISKTELLMLYSGASSGIIVILGMLGILYCFKKRICKSKSKRLESINEEVQNATGLVQHESLELHERIYEEIDESKLESTLNPRTHILNFGKEQISSTSASITNRCLQSKNDKSKMEVPVEKKSNIGVDDQGPCIFYPAREEDSSSSDSSSDCICDRSSYLHPYNTLSIKKSNYHTCGSAKNIVQSVEDSN